ncbi:MAG TPA: glycosyltransferase [Anaerolineaceae bacterium]|nr:glycosyltransferase [Anaerolineaceae bacterium]
MENIESPKISVVMPVYNGGRFLREAIDSILNQTYEDFEFIIIDDGSTDQTSAILDSYQDTRIVRLTHTTNLGLVQSLNDGIAIARGKYIARMDADDWCLPERFEKQVRFLDSHPDVAVLGTACTRVTDNGKVQRVVENPSQPGLVRWQLLFGVPVNHPSVFIRKQIFDDPDITYRTETPHAEDFALWVKIVPKYKISNLQESLHFYRWHDDNISVREQSTQQKWTHEIIQSQVLQITGEEIPKRLIGPLQKPQKLENIADAKCVARFYFLLLKSTKVWGLTDEEAIDIRLDVISRLNSAWRAIKKNPLFLGTMMRVPILRAEILWLVAKRKLNSLVNIAKTRAVND